ncbi:MAG: hypothetical protein WBA39_26740 [Rivularia sp. (in: cyanobacteria)]
MIDEITGLQLITTPHVCREELNYLIQQMECAELARIAFIGGELSLSDYCDILQLCNINVDQYLLIVEENLTTAKVL